MRQRPGILAELVGAQVHRVDDPLDGMAARVAGELLVAIHRQPLLETQLEPVAAGDPVAGPVVKVFVGDDRLDTFVVGVRRGIG